MGSDSGMPTPLPAPDISIIICTFNRAFLLRRVLAALGRQTVDSHEFEIIVVDDGSTDPTPQTCRDLMAQVPNLRTVRLEQNSGVAAAYSRGVEAARGRLVLFTDDDAIPDPSWLSEMQLALKEHAIVAGAVDAPSRDWLSLAKNIAQCGAFLPGRKARTIGFIAGANMGFRHEVLDRVGPFQNTPVAETEYILRCRQQGYAVWFHPASVVVHDPPSTRLSDLLRYAAKHSQHTIALRQEYRDVLKTPLVLRSPGLLLLSSPLIALASTGQVWLQNPRVWRYLFLAPVVFLAKMAWCWGAYRGLRAASTAEP